METPSSSTPSSSTTPRTQLQQQLNNRRNRGNILRESDLVVRMDALGMLENYDQDEEYQHVRRQQQRQHQQERQRQRGLLSSNPAASLVRQQGGGSGGQYHRNHYNHPPHRSHRQQHNNLNHHQHQHPRHQHRKPPPLPTSKLQQQQQAPSKKQTPTFYRLEEYYNIELHGTCDATIKAINEGSVTVLPCICCNIDLCCIDSMDLVLCPECQTFTPLQLEVIDDSTSGFYNSSKNCNSRRQSQPHNYDGRGDARRTMPGAVARSNDKKAGLGFTTQAIKELEEKKMFQHQQQQQSNR